MLRRWRKLADGYDPNRVLIGETYVLDWGVAKAIGEADDAFPATGEGLTAAGNVTGQPAGAPYPRPRLPVHVAVEGIDAEILYAGSAPGFVGAMQLDVRVPGGFVPPGRTTIQMSVGDFTSPAVTVWLK